MMGAVNSVLQLSTGLLVWTITGWRGHATANLTRPAHWRVDAAKRKADGAAWRTLLAVAAAGRPRWLPLSRYTLVVSEFGRPVRDPDAVIQSIKRGWDALVRAGWLAGDSPAYCRGLAWRPMVIPVDVAATEGVQITVEAVSA